VTINTGSVPGQYSVQLAGDDGSAQHSGSVALTIQGFTVTDPGVVPEFTGHGIPYYLQYNSFGGYHGFLNVTCDASALPGGASCYAYVGSIFTNQQQGRMYP